MTASEPNTALTDGESTVSPVDPSVTQASAPEVELAAPASAPEGSASAASAAASAAD